MQLEPENELAAGQLVGEYEVERKLGQGGFGAVYLARHPLIGKVVAIKILARQYSAQPEMVSRFVSEARSVNQIRSRHIVDIFSFGQLADGRHYYVMEYLAGCSLAEELSARGALSVAETLQLLEPIAKALHAAHKHGIAHRDLKPDNVLLGKEGDEVTPKLLDFGIAKLLGDKPTQHKTQTGAPMGTPNYMSPEQARGKDVDHRTDIYAFGVMVFEMLSGRLPFEGDDFMTILIGHLNEPPPPLGQFVAGCGPALERVVASMLEKDRDARPQTINAAWEALVAAAAEAGDAAVRSMITSTGQARALTSAKTLPSMHAQTIAAGSPHGPVPSTESVTGGGWKKLTAPLGIGAALLAGFVIWRVVGGNSNDSGPSANVEFSGGRTVARPIDAVVAANVVPDAAMPPNVPAPTEATTVKISFSGAPEGSVVKDTTGTILGSAAAGFEVPRNSTSLELFVDAPGFTPQRFAVVPSADLVMAVDLKKAVTKPLPVKARKKASGEDSIDDSL